MELTVTARSNVEKTPFIIVAPLLDILLDILVTTHVVNPPT